MSFPQVAIRHLTINLDGLRVPLNATERAEVQGEIPYWGANAVVDQVDRALVSGPLVLVGEDGAPFSDPLRPVAFAIDEPIWPNNHIHVLRPTAGVDYRFLAYALNCVDYSRYIEGSTRDKLTQSALSSITVPTPAASEQRQIADYLDHETAEIDAFIADLESLRARLEEHRMAELASFLTYPKDLFRPDASSVVPLRHLGSIVLGKMLDAVAPTEQTRWRYLRAANIQPLGRLALDDIKTMRFSPAERASLDVRAGDVLVVEGGQGGFGRAAFVSADLPELGFQNSIVRFRPGPRADGRYVAYGLHLLRHSGYIKTVASVTSMPHFTAEKVAVTPIPLMSMDRQCQIADALDARWSEIDQASEDIEAAIALATERRAALITAAVTGQIDVTTKQKPVVDWIQTAIEEAR